MDLRLRGDDREKANMPPKDTQGLTARKLKPLLS